VQAEGNNIAFSGKSIAGKNSQSFKLNEGLLAKCVEAFKKGKIEAREGWSS
jgi:lipopolysaccharide assembly outer membrane protein LptD (OstA)